MREEILGGGSNAAKVLTVRKMRISQQTMPFRLPQNMEMQVIKMQKLHSTF